jgi:hypothetical protein
MKYAYYPGCSLTESAREFDVSTRMVMERLGCELIEIPDWTCCGASAAEPVSKLMNYALPARNLAIVEQEMSGPEGVLHARVRDHEYLGRAQPLGADAGVLEAPSAENHFRYGELEYVHGVILWYGYIVSPISYQGARRDNFFSFGTLPRRFAVFRRGPSAPWPCAA